MSSRLGHDQRGRLIVEVVVPSQGLPAGKRFIVRGDTFSAGAMGIGFPGGRTPEPAKRQPRPERRTGGVHHSWPAEYPERARELHARGLSCPKVAATLGIPFGTCKSWIWAESQTWEKRKAQRKRRQAQAAT